MPHKLPPDVKHAVGPPRKQNRLFICTCICGWTTRAQSVATVEDRGTKHIMDEEVSCDP